MRQETPIRRGTMFWLAVLAVGALARAGNGAAAAAPAMENAEQAFRDAAPAVDQLDRLAQRFDADHDQVLSPQEQEAMIAFVADKYGPQWVERLRRFLRAADANHDGRIDLAEWTRAVAQVRRYGKTVAELPKPQTVRIAMSDGVHLATDIYLPKGEGPFPVVLSRTPYGRGSFRRSSANLVAANCVSVVQDARGRFDSEGDNLPFVGCGWGEHRDGVETVAWIKKQPWCNGKIGTLGTSAGGITQNLLAGAVPDGLTAQHITVAAASLYSDASYIGGAFRQADAAGWLTNNKFDPRGLAIILARPSYDDYWKKFDTTRKFEVMNVPAVHVGGWFDMFAQGTIDEFVGRQHHGANGSRGTQKLVMGPWTHGIGKMPVGELTFPGANRVPEPYDSGRWFDHYLHGADNGVEKEPAVAYYVMGDTSTSGAPGNEWRRADDWPVPANETPFYFTREGKLAPEKPAGGGESHVEFTFDPRNPCPTVGGNNLTLARGPMNQNRIERRGDVVLFTSAPLAAPLEVTGRVRAKTYIATSAADTDLSVRLCDVYPDGKSYLIAEGMLRLRYRNSMEKPELLAPGQIAEVSVDCWSTSIIFNRGHRIRVAVTSSNYPRFDVNPGTGRPWRDGESSVKQTNRIFCDAAHPSRIVLPVAAGKAD